MKNKCIFKSVIIDKQENTFQILNGTEGVYPINNISRLTVLNEKATKKGKQTPFLALMPDKGLPTGLLSTPYLFVGIQVILTNGDKLAIYVSQVKTQVGTEQYRKDREEAKLIVSQLERYIK